MSLFSEITVRTYYWPTAWVETTGVLDGSLSAVEAAGVGTSAIAAVLTSQLAEVACSSVGDAPTAAVLDSTLSIVEASGAGSATIGGTLAATLAEVACEGEGTVAGYTGTISITALGNRYVDVPGDLECTVTGDVAYVVWAYNVGAGPVTIETVSSAPWTSEDWTPGSAVETTITATAYAEDDSVLDEDSAVVDVSAVYTLSTTPGTVLGPFTVKEQYISAPQGTGPDIAEPVTVILDIWNDGTSATDKCLYGVCRSGHGWWLDQLGDFGLALMLPGGTPAYRFLYNANTALRNGHNRIGFSRLVDGSFIFSLNGYPAAAVDALTTVVAIDATCDHWIGRVSAAVSSGGYPSKRAGVLSVLHIASAATLEQLTAWTDAANAEDRFAQHADVISHADLVSWLDIARDWDGESATMLAGAGSAPLTFTINDAVVSTVLGHEKVITIKGHSDWLHNDSDYSVVDLGGATEHVEMSDKAQIKIATDATHIGVRCYSDYTALSQKWMQFGVDDGTTFQSCPATRHSTYEVIDAKALAAGSKTVEICGGVLSNPTPFAHILGDWMQSVRVPESATVSIVLPERSGRVLVIDGDSIASGDGPTNAIEGFAYLLGRGHAKLYPGNVQVEAWGYRAGYHVWSTEGSRQAWAAKIAAMFVDYSTAELLEELGTNDYGFGLSAADYVTYGGDAMDRLHALAPSATVWWLSLLLRTPTDESTPNSYGDLPQAYRDGAVTIAATRPYITVLDGPTMLPGLATVHPNTAQSATLATNLASAMGL